MLRKLALISIIIVQTITVSGCWDYRDINSVAFPQLGAYDVHEESKTAANNLSPEEKKVDLTIVIPNLAQEAQSKFRIEKTSGLLIGSARGQKPYSAPAVYSAGVAGTIIFGEDLAATGLNKYSEALLRGAQYPNTENFAVAEGRGENIIRIPTSDYPSMGDYMRAFLRSSDKRCFIPATTLHKFEVDQNPGKNPIMPLLTIKDEKVMFSGTAIFKKDKMIGKANLRESQYLMMLRGIKSTGNLPFILLKDGKITDTGSVNVYNTRKVKVERNGDDFTFRISIMLAGNLIDHSSQEKFLENANLRKEIENKIDDDVTEGCYQFIKKMQGEYKVDCIDISKYVLAKSRKELQNKIDGDFIENVNIKVDVKLSLKNVGELN